MLIILGLLLALILIPVIIKDQRELWFGIPPEFVGPPTKHLAQEWDNTYERLANNQRKIDHRIVNRIKWEQEIADYRAQYPERFDNQR